MLLRQHGDAVDTEIRAYKGGHGYVFVTCHLHFWQNDQDLLHAIEVAWGCSGNRNKSAYKGGHGYVFVTCHLHFWQNDQDLLHAVVVAWGWNGYQMVGMDTKKESACKGGHG